MQRQAQGLKVSVVFRFSGHAACCFFSQRGLVASCTETGKNQISAAGCWWASSSVASHRIHGLLCWGLALTHHFILNLKQWGEKSVACTHENGVCMFFYFKLKLQQLITVSQITWALICSVVWQKRDLCLLLCSISLQRMFQFDFQLFWSHKLMNFAAPVRPPFWSVFKHQACVQTFLVVAVVLDTSVPL